MASAGLLRAAAAAALMSVSGAAAADAIVNIDATRNGFAFPTDPAPVPGQLITPIGTPLNQLTLPAGTYNVTNAAGLLFTDPSFIGWRFNGGASWVWNFVIADDATDRVVLYGEADGIQATQALIAAEPAVQNFSAMFTLPATTTLDFMVRDWFLGDNAGGVALYIAAAATPAIPEPEQAVLLLAGLMLLGLRARKRNCPGSGRARQFRT
jgi:hypothetical protein